MIQIAFKCKICSDYIVGIYHELVSCKCNKSAIDVGSMTYRTVGDLFFPNQNWTDFCLEKNASSEEIREKLLWGSYGINDEGKSLLDLWAEKEPKKSKLYHSTQAIWQFERLEDFLTKKEYQQYFKWLESKPKKEYTLMKDMNSDHILNIIRLQTHISKPIKDAFILELESRGIKINE